MHASSTRFGLPKRLRLRRTRDYRRVQDRGQRIREQHLLALFLPGRALPGQKPESRIGITVSRKVGNAVVRNRVKRWLREAIRHERQCLETPARAEAKLQGTWDVVLIAHPSAAGSSAAAIRRDVASAFSRLSRSRQPGGDRKAGGARRAGGDQRERR